MIHVQIELEIETLAWFFLYILGGDPMTEPHQDILF